MAWVPDDEPQPYVRRPLSRMPVASPDRTPAERSDDDQRLEAGLPGLHVPRGPVAPDDMVHDWARVV